MVYCVLFFFFFGAQRESSTVVGLWKGEAFPVMLVSIQPSATSCRAGWKLCDDPLQLLPALSQGTEDPALPGIFNLLLLYLSPTCFSVFLGHSEDCLFTAPHPFGWRTTQLSMPVLRRMTFFLNKSSGPVLVNHEISLHGWSAPHLGFTSEFSPSSQRQLKGVHIALVFAIPVSSLLLMSTKLTKTLK